jgi:hypothetical protein
MTKLTIIRVLPTSEKRVKLTLTDDLAVVVDADTQEPCGSYAWSGSALTGEGPLPDEHKAFLASQILDALAT